MLRLTGVSADACIGKSFNSRSFALRKPGFRRS